MGNFNRGGFGGNRGGDRGHRFGGGRDSGRQGGFRREDRGPVTMTKVICDDCKKSCEVPFQPTAGKPVYCNDCFRNQGGAGQNRPPRRDFNDRAQAPRPGFGGNEGGSDIKRQLDILNSKMDKLISSLEGFTQSKVASVSKPALKAEEIVVKAKPSKNEVVKSIVVALPKKEAKKEVKKVAKKGKKK